LNSTGYFNTDKKRKRNRKLGLADDDAALIMNDDDDDANKVRTNGECPIA